MAEAGRKVQTPAEKKEREKTNDTRDRLTIRLVEWSIANGGVQAVTKDALSSMPEGNAKVEQTRIVTGALRGAATQLIGEIRRRMASRLNKTADPTATYGKLADIDL